MTIQLIETAVDALKAYLEAQMPAKITALNTRYGGTITLEAIKTYYSGNMPASTPESPSIVVHGGGFVPKEQRLASLMLANNITIIVFVGDDNVENRFRRLARYTVGIVELLRTAKDTIGYVVKLAGPADITEPMNTQPFLQGYTIPVTLEKAEEY